MPKYTVRLVCEVSDTLEAFVDIEAANPEAAALETAGQEDNGLDWQVAYEGDKQTPEVDSIRDNATGREY